MFFGCSGKEPVPPATISSEYSAKLHILCGKSEYSAEIIGTDRMMIISPDALSLLEFRNENGIIIAQYGRQTISEEQTDVPLKDLFVRLSAILKKVGNGEYTQSEGIISYSESGCSLTLDCANGLPESFSGNGYEVEFIY